MGTGVTIGVVTFNAPRHIARCLDSIAANTARPHEVRVVDNASDEATVGLLRGRSDIALEVNAVNRLWCPAMNQALAGATSPYLLLLNPDVEILRPDWLDRLVSVLERNPRVGMTGVEHNFRALRPTWGAIDGHCLLVRREVWEECGPLDEALPWNGAPFVLTARARAAGWRYRLHPPRPGLVRHAGGASRVAAPIENRKLDHDQRLRDAGLEPVRMPPVVSGVARRAIGWGLVSV